MANSIIPIRFTYEEKYIIQSLAKEMNIPLSTFIKQEFLKLIQPKLLKMNKATIMFDRLENIKVSKNDIQKASIESKKFRKNLKITKD